MEVFHPFEFWLRLIQDYDIIKTGVTHILEVAGWLTHKLLYLH